MGKTILCLICLLFAVPRLHAQAAPTATRPAGLQVGVLGSSYSLDYGDGREEGIAVFADYDFRMHLGLEAVYRNASLETPHDLGENHFLIGPRYHITRKRFSPYAKILVGLGQLEFQSGTYANPHSDSYFIYALGGGLDVRVTRHINIRAIDFEYQEWPGFQPHGLTPVGFSAGAAWKF